MADPVNPTRSSRGTIPNPSPEDVIVDREIEEQRGSEPAKDAAISIGTTAATGAAVGAAGGAVAGGAFGGATATGGASFGASVGAASGATSALAAAWPIAVLTTIYLGYKSYSKLKKQVGTNLTAEEATAAIDVLALNRNTRKWLPKEVLFGKTAAEFLGGALGSKKSDDQILRDRWRQGLKQAGFSTVTSGDFHYIELADGNFYDIGRDGGSTIATFDPNVDIDGSGPGAVRAVTLDSSNPISQQTVGFINPLAAMSTGGDIELTAMSTAILSNAAMSNAGGDIEVARQNALAQYEKAFGQAARANGVSTQEVALGSLQALYDSGNITEEEFVAYSNGIRQLYGSAELTPPGTPFTEDPTAPEGAQNADPRTGNTNNTATAGVVLDERVGTDTLGRVSQDTVPNIGDEDNLVPRIATTEPVLSTDPQRPAQQPQVETTPPPQPAAPQQPAQPPVSAATSVSQPPAQPAPQQPQFEGGPALLDPNQPFVDGQPQPAPQQPQQAPPAPSQGFGTAATAVSGGQGPSPAQGFTTAAQAATPPQLQIAPNQQFVPRTGSPAPREAPPTGVVTPEQVAETGDVVNAPPPEETPSGATQADVQAQTDAIVAQQAADAALAREQAAEAQRKSLLSSLALAEISKQQQLLNRPTAVSGRQRFGQGSQGLIDIIGQ